MSMTADMLLQQLGSSGVEPENTGDVLKRMEGMQSTGITPAEFYAVYNNGDLMSEFKADCAKYDIQPTPDVPSISSAFNNVAQPGAAEGPVLTQTSNFKIG